MFLEAVDAWKSVGGQKIAVHAQMGVAAWPRPIRQLGIYALATRYQWRQQPDVLAAVSFEQLGGNAFRRLRLHRCAVLETMLNAELHVEQAQKMPDLSRGAHCRFAATAREPLLNCHRGWNAVHRVHLGAPCRLHDGAGIGVEALQIAALAFVEKNVKSQGGFAGTGDAGDDAEFAARNVDAEGLEVVFFGVDDSYAFPTPLTPPAEGGRACARSHISIGRGKLCHFVHHAKRCCIVAQRFSGMRSRMQEHIFWRATCNHFTARIAAFGAQVDKPVRGANHIEVVFNHHQRMARIEQLAQRTHELGNVVKVQAGGGLVEHEQGAASGGGLAACGVAFGSFGQETSQL